MDSRDASASKKHPQNKITAPNCPLEELISKEGIRSSEKEETDPSKSPPPPREKFIKVKNTIIDGGNTLLYNAYIVDTVYFVDLTIEY